MGLQSATRITLVALALCFSQFSYSAPPKYSIISDRAHKTLLIDVVRAGSRIVAVGQRGHILYSDDNGDSWTQAKVPSIALLTSVFFVDAKNGWAVGHDTTILHSTDGGENWVVQKFDPFDPNAPFEEEALDEEVDWNSNDNWEDEPLPPPQGEPLLDVWFKNKRLGYAVGAYGYFLRTNDGGKTWTDWSKNIDNYDGAHYYSMNQTINGVLFMVGEMGTMYRSIDDGSTWETLTSPYDGSLFGVLPTKSPNVVLAFGLQGNVFRSTDLGESWKSITVKSDQSLNGGAVLADGAIVVVGNSGVVLRSTDGGRSFSTQINSDRLSLVGIINAKDKNLVMVGQGGAKRTNPAGKPL